MSEVLPDIEMAQMSSGRGPDQPEALAERRPARRGRLINPKLGWVLLFLVAASLPLFLAPYPISLGSRVLAFALLVISVDLLTGVTGLPTLGQVAYFGAGAYTASLVGIHWTDNVIVQLAAGIVVAALVALVTGAVCVRTSGIVFLMVTLAVGELSHQLADSWSFVGGSNGLAGIPPITIFPGQAPLLLPGYVYWWVLVVFVLGAVAAVLVVRSPLGRSMRGVRDGEKRLRALGQETYSIKLLAYVIAGALAGAAGTAWSAQARFISPGDLSFDIAAFAFLSVVLGGAGTLWGPVIGAAVVILLKDWVAGYVEGHGALLLGVVFVLAAYALPKGIAGARWRLRPVRRRDQEGVA